MAGIVVAVWVALSAGVWLLVMGKRHAGWGLLGATGVFLSTSLLIGSQPIPRWVADSRWTALRGWYSLVDASEPGDYVALAALLVHPVVVVFLVAIAWRKGRRWAAALLPCAVAPFAASAVSVALRQGRPGNEWADLEGFLVGALIYLVALVIAIPTAAIGSLPPLPERTSPSADLDPLVVLAAVTVVAILGSVVVFWGVGPNEQGRSYVEYPGLMGAVRVEGVDTEGGVWVTVHRIEGDPDGPYPELARYHEGEWETWSVHDDLHAERITSIGFGDDGSIWIAGARDNSVRRYLDGSWLHYESCGERPFVVGFVPVEGGRMWAYGHGVFELEDGQVRPIPGPPIPFLNDVVAAPDGSIWAIGYRSWTASQEYRVAHMVDGEWVEYPDLRISGNVFESLAVAEGGDVWVSYRSVEPASEVCWRFDGTSWTRWDTEGDEPSECDAAVAVSHATYGSADGPGGVRWEGGRNGIYRVDQTTSARSPLLVTATTTLPPTTSTVTTTSIPPDEPTSTTTSIPVTTTTVHPFHVGMDGSATPSTPALGELFGSGCTPGSDVLPDGVWFGRVDVYDVDTVTFDLCCLSAAEGGVTLSNVSSRLRRPMVTDETIVWARPPEGTGWDRYPYPEWEGPSSACPTGDPPYHDGCFWWLYVNDGVVTEMLEVAFR